MSSVTPPALWTTWRDRRDGTLVTVVQLPLWGRHIGPCGVPLGYLSVEIDSVHHGGSIRRLDQDEFESHFELVYDPHTGFDAAVAA